MLTIEFESARATLCKWATCTRQTFLSKTFAKSLNIQKQYEKNVWEKSNDAYSLSIRVQTTINHISIFTLLCFLRGQKNVFFQSASWKRHCATHWRERRGCDLVVFDWFVLSMRMQVILDSSFARPLYGAGKKESSGTGLKYTKRNLQDLTSAYSSLKNSGIESFVTRKNVSRYLFPWSRSHLYVKLRLVLERWHQLCFFPLDKIASFIPVSHSSPSGPSPNTYW